MDWHGIKDDFVETFSKIWVILLYIFIGIVGKFSNDLLLGKRLTFKQVIGQAGVCLFCGFLSWVLCKHIGWEDYAGIICPIATYVSDKIMIAIYTIDWRSTILDIITNFLKRK